MTFAGRNQAGRIPIVSRSAFLCLLLGLSLLPACTSLTSEGAKVRVTMNPDAVHGCEFLGNVSASSGWGGPAGGNAGEESVQYQMQNETAKHGGNVLFIVSSKARYSTRGVGEAYRCPPR